VTRTHFGPHRRSSRPRAVPALLGAVLAAVACRAPEPAGRGTAAPGPATAAREATAATSPAEALLERSLRVHDPDGVWGRRAVPLAWTSSRSDGSVSFRFEVLLGLDGSFTLVGERAGHRLDYRVEDGEVVRARVDGSAEVPDDVREALVLGRDDGLFWRDYLGFLAGVPMCLRDPGARLEPAVAEAQLEGRAVLAVRATFEPDADAHRWTFYFEPDTARVVGCRFHRVDPGEDGETLVFEGLTSVAGLRLPRTRRWWTNADGRFLGTDELRAAGEE